MITKDNIKHCFDSLTSSEISEVFDSNCDFMAFECHTFNVGSYATIKPFYFGEFESESNGNLFIDKDDFLRLFKESDSVNPYLIELL